MAELSFWADTHYLSRAEVRVLLRRLERLLVAAADRDVPLPSFPPVARGPEWVRVGP